MMGCANNPEIMAFLEEDRGESIIFSCAVNKFNRWGMKQERTFLLTTLYLYNIKKSEIQRRISVKSIKAVTKSTLKGNT